MRQDITLDVRKRETSFGRAKLLPLRRGEKGNRELVVSIEEDGRAYDLSGKTASLVATTAAGKLVGPCPMEVAQAGIARIMLPAALYSAVGAFTGYVEIREGDTLVDTTDSFGGKVIECADLDSEQAAEFTPLLGELQNAVAEEAKRVEAEKARVQAEAERETGFAEAKQAAQTAAEAANDAAADANLAAGTASDAAKSANTAAGKATNAAAKAESDVRAFVNAASTAVGDAIAGAKADVDAAVKRSDAATAKAEAAVKTADAANTAANQAVGDARDAIAEVKATEAKLYPVAENILAGSETGAVAHVEDAFDGAALREITVEGACKQDGIPSPESPKPITVIEHPTVKVVGRNVLDFVFPTFQAAYSSGIAVIPGYAFDKKQASLPYMTPASSSGFGFIQRLMPGSYTVKASNAPQKATVSVAGYASYEDVTDKNKSIWNKTEQYLNAVSTFEIEGEQPQWVVFCFAAEWGDDTNKITYPADFKAVVEYGGTATEYKPHTSQTLTFALPAEHPYLAKLPDGTADEIVVDEEGNVELVARVLQIKVPEGATWNIQAQEGGFSLGYLDSAPGVESIEKNLRAIALMSDKFMSKAYWENTPCFGVSGVLWVVPRTNQNDITSEDVEAVANGMVFYAPLATAVTYPLGKIEMPKAQDSIVVANIEKAIASITEG